MELPLSDTRMYAVCCMCSAPRWIARVVHSSPRVEESRSERRLSIAIAVLIFALSLALSCSGIRSETDTGRPSEVHVNVKHSHAPSAPNPLPTRTRPRREMYLSRRLRRPETRPRRGSRASTPTPTPTRDFALIVKIALCGTVVDTIYAHPGGRVSFGGHQTTCNGGKGPPALRSPLHPSPHAP